nr:DUF4238 domain-containing protein [Terracidiphilus gabretensis]
MKSHTVPKRLLRQFAYLEASTRSDRLWRYEKDRAPYSKASPDTATRIDGHFADPEDAAIEATIERRLAYEIEDPVNQFIANFCDPLFAMNDEQKRKMTRYVTLLFNRSIARRNATQHLLEIRNNALNHFLSNEIQLETVAAHWNIDAFFKGLRFGRLITREDVGIRAREFVVANTSGREAQMWYAQGTLRAIAGFDEVLFRGEWRLYPQNRMRHFCFQTHQLSLGTDWSLESWRMGLDFTRPTLRYFCQYRQLLACISFPTLIARVELQARR